MWNRRSRRRGAGRSSQLLYYMVVGGLVLAAVGVLAISINPSMAFSSVALDRPGNIGVVDDSNGVVGLDVATSVTAGSRDHLVKVINNNNKNTKFTVRLDDPSQGTLYKKNGPSVGDEYTETLSYRESFTLEIEATLSGNKDWTTGEPCSEPENHAEVDGWNVTFYCAKYDSNADETTYEYSVTPEESATHDLSHIVFGFENGFDPYVESTSPDAEDEEGNDEGDIKTDPVTSSYGLKFEQQISKNGAGQTYKFTINGDHGTTTTDHGLKYGPNAKTVQLPGPAVTSDSPSNGETMKFTVESSTTEVTGTLVRSVTIEPDTDSNQSTSNDAPTADFTSNRKGNSPNVELDASPSSDPDGSIVTYEWDVNGDGSTDHTGKTVTVKVSSGTSVTLTVTDDQGKTASKTKPVD